MGLIDGACMRTKRNAAGITQYVNLLRISEIITYLISELTVNFKKGRWWPKG